MHVHCLSVFMQTLCDWIFVLFKCKYPSLFVFLFFYLCYQKHCGKYKILSSVPFTLCPTIRKGSLIFYFFIQYFAGLSSDCPPELSCRRLPVLSPLSQTQRQISLPAGWKCKQAHNRHASGWREISHRTKNKTNICNLSKGPILVFLPRLDPLLSVHIE